LFIYKRVPNAVIIVSAFGASKALKGGVNMQVYHPHCGKFYRGDIGAHIVRCENDKNKPFLKG